MIEWTIDSDVTTIEQIIGGVQTVYLSLRDEDGSQSVELVACNFNYNRNKQGVECDIILTCDDPQNELEIVGLNLKQLDDLIAGLQKIRTAISYNMEKANNG